MGEALMHVVCPECEQPIELPAQGAGEKINCPTCGKEFEARGTIVLPKSTERTEFQKMLAREPLPKMESPWTDAEIRRWNSQGSASEYERLQAWANGFGIVRNILLVLAGLTVLAGLFNSAGSADGEHPFWPFAVAAGCFLTITAWFSLLGHLVHIRATLERLARKD